MRQPRPGSTQRLSRANCAQVMHNSGDKSLGYFDLVLSFTFLQHLPEGQQDQVLDRVLKVLKPGGHFLAFENARDRGPHVFSRSPQQWVAAFRRAGMKVHWIGGFCFAPASQIAAGVRRHLSRADTLADFIPQPSGTSFAWRAARWIYRVISALIDWVSEPLAEAICPSGWGTHVALLASRPPAGSSSWGPGGFE